MAQSRIFLVRTPIANPDKRDGAPLVLMADDVDIGQSLVLFDRVPSSNRLAPPTRYVVAAFAPGTWITCEETTQEKIDAAREKASTPELVMPSGSDVVKHGKGH